MSYSWMTFLIEMGSWNGVILYFYKKKGNEIYGCMLNLFFQTALSKIRIYLLYVQNNGHIRYS